MPKLNVAYRSLFETLAVKKGSPTYLPVLSSIFFKLDALFYREEHARVNDKDASYGRRFNPYWSYNKVGMQLLGGLQPFQDMLKDFSSTFRPYKHPTLLAIDSDLLYFYLGPVYFLKGIATLAAIPFIFTGFTLYHLRSPKNFWPNLAASAVLSASWGIEGLSTIARSITLSLGICYLGLVRTGIRVAISLFSKKPMLEENAGTRYLVQLGQATLQSLEKVDLDKNQKSTHAKIKYLRAICDRLHVKHKKAYADGNSWTTQSSRMATVTLGGTDKKVRKLERHFDDYTYQLLINPSVSNQEKVTAAKDFISFFSIRDSDRAHALSHAQAAKPIKLSA